MKVVRENTDRLILKDSPWLIPVLASILCVAFGCGVLIGAIPNETNPWPILLLPPIALLASIYYFERTEVVFDLSENAVRITRRRLLRTTAINYALDALSDVNLDGVADSDGGTCRVMLHFTNLPKPVPLTFYETNSPAMLDIAKRIQNWLPH